MLLLVHLSGGDVIRETRGTAERHRSFHREARAGAQAPGGRAGRSLRERAEIRAIWISRGEKDTSSALFNWSDKPGFLSFDPAAYGLTGTSRLLDGRAGQRCRRVRMPGGVPACVSA